MKFGLLQFRGRVFLLGIIMHPLWGSEGIRELGLRFLAKSQRGLKKVSIRRRGKV